ncbi:MAG: MoaD/ThiS family protein [Burkholderiaceae bacterium]
MRITFKLFAMLEDHLPRELGEHRRVGNALPLDVPDGTTVQSIIDQFRLPPRLVHLVLVDGRYVEPGDRANRALTEGEVLAIWPPVAGG